MTNALPDCEDRFPNCLRMELAIEPIETKGFLQKIWHKKPKQIDLSLNLHFGEHEEQIESGSVSFRIKRGKLKLELTNGEVPPQNIKLKYECQTLVEIEEEEAGGNETEREESAVSNLEIGINFPGTERSNKKVQTWDYLVYSQGGLHDPTWIFVPKVDKQFLQGSLQNADLATVEIVDRPCRLIATFKVTKPDDIALTRFPARSQKNLSKKKIAIIERGIVRRFLDEKLKNPDYISRVESIYG